jgi:hypothetical protein
MLNYDKTHFLQFLTKTDNELNIASIVWQQKNCYCAKFKISGANYATTLTW